MRARIRWATRLAGVVLTALAVAPATGDDGRVVWPVLVSAKRGGDLEACRELPGESVRIVEDGSTAPVVGVFDDRWPRLHVFVIGAGPDSVHEGILAAALDALALHVERLPDRDAAMVFSMGSTLELRLPPTPLADPERRRTVHEALEGIGGSGRGSLGHWMPALLDALEDYPDRKVLLNVANPTDYSLNRASTELVTGPETAIYSVQFVREVPQPQVGIERYDIAPTETVRFGGVSDDVARKSGGKLLLVKQPRAIPDRLRDLRLRLRRDATAIWIPQPFGQGKKDRAESHLRERKLRVRSLDRRCRIETPIESYPAAPIRRSSADRLTRGNSAFSRPGRVPLPDSRRAIPRGVQSGLRVLDGTIEGTFLDIVDESGAAPDEDLLAEAYLMVGGQARALSGVALDGFTGPELQWRDFRIAVPDLDDLTSERIASPEDALLFAWAHGSDGLEPYCLHGRTLLAVRDRIALAFYAYYEPYRQWAQERVRTAVAGDIDRRYPDASGDEREALTVDRLSRLTAGDLRPHLGGWIGDVRASDLAAAVERRALQLWLSTAGPDRGEAVEVADRVTSRWSELNAAYGAERPMTVRSLLVPAFDPERDRIGFYRVVLERPGGVAPEPRALRLLREAFPAGLAGLAVSELRYRFGASGDRWMVRMMVGRDTGGSGRLDLGFGPAEGEGEDPWVVTCASAPDGFAKLAAAVERLGVSPCGAP